MMRSLSTSALGQPSETKLTEGAADFVMFLARTVLSYRRSCARSSRPAFGSPPQAFPALQKPPFLMHSRALLAHWWRNHASRFDRCRLGSGAAGATGLVADLSDQADPHPGALCAGRHRR